MNKKPDVDFEGVVVLEERETSWKMRIVGSNHWMPKSQCKYDETEKTLTVPEWLAIERGLV